MIKHIEIPEEISNAATGKNRAHTFCRRCKGDRFGFFFASLIKFGADSQIQRFEAGIRHVSNALRTNRKRMKLSSLH